MKRLAVILVLNTAACIGGQFSIGESADGGPLLAELAPDVAMTEDGGANDPPDADQPDAGTTKGDARSPGEDGREAAPSPEASTPEEASTTEEASTPEEASAPEEASTPEASTLEASTPEATPPDAGCSILYCQAPQSTTDCSGLSASNTLSYSCTGTCAAGDLCTFHFAAYPGCTGTVLCAE
jgi:hypothetical protein